MSPLVDATFQLLKQKKTRMCFFKVREILRVQLSQFHYQRLLALTGVSSDQGLKLDRALSCVLDPPNFWLQVRMIISLLIS